MRHRGIKEPHTQRTSVSHTATHSFHDIPSNSTSCRQWPAQFIQSLLGRAMPLYSYTHRRTRLIASKMQQSHRILRSHKSDRSEVEASRNLGNKASGSASRSKKEGESCCGKKIQVINLQSVYHNTSSGSVQRETKNDSSSTVEQKHESGRKATPLVSWS